MANRKVKKPKPAFDEDELAERIEEAFRRALAAPAFKEFRYCGLELSAKHDAFVKLWIEEALRHAHIPSHRQTAQANYEEERKARLHLSLTSAQQRELVRVFDEPFPEDRATRRAWKRIPRPTYQALHSIGLVSTTQTVTELGGLVALNIKLSRTRSTSD